MSRHTVSALITDDQLNKEITIESNGNPTIKAKTSSATGFGQFLNQTWLGTLKKHGPSDIASRIVKKGNRWVVPDGGEQQILNLRKATTPALKRLNIDMLARFTEDNAKAIGSGFTDGDLYLAHFLGAAAAKKLFRADQDAAVEPIVGAAAVKANHSILSGKTVAQVRRWAQNAMDTRWRKAGNPDWIAKFYKPDAELPNVPVPKPTRDIAGDDDDELGTKVPEMIDLDHDGIDDRLQQPRHDAPPIEPPDQPEEEQPADPQPPVVVAAGVRGDPSIWHIQRRLKAMNYNPGGLDGIWGGMTAEAIAGFLNDRPTDVPAPTSLKTFRAMRSKIESELTTAESENFKRPVSPERRNADDKKVEEVAPEAKPVNQSYFAAKWAAFVAWLSTMGTAFKDHIANAFSFWRDNKDDIPVEGEGIMSHVMSFFQSVPAFVWVGIGAVVITLLAVKLFTASKTIGDQVRTGARK